MTNDDPYDYPRCEICAYAIGAKCTHPGPVKMGESYMSWPRTSYDSYCDKFTKDEEALRTIREFCRGGEGHG